MLNQELFEEFCDEFTREMNRLRMEQRAGLVSAERELERVKREIQKVIDAIVQGVPGSELKDKTVELQRRNEALTARIVAANEPPPLIHPEMVYRRSVAELGYALQNPDARPEAAKALRALVDGILLIPDGEVLRLELRGKSGGDVVGGHKCEEVAGNRRPLAANSDGCGGPQHIVPAALLGGSVNVRTLTLLTEVPHVRPSLG